MVSRWGAWFTLAQISLQFCNGELGANPQNEAEEEKEEEEL